MSITSPFGAVTGAQGLAVAQGYLSAGRLDEAEALLDDVLKTRPNDVEALNALGGLWLARKDGDRARAILSAAATAAPDHFGLINNLGIAHQMGGRFAEAIICFERASALAPEREAPRQALAMTHFLNSDLPAARAIAQGILARSPDSADGHALMGLIALADGEPETAEAHLRRALAAKPDDPASLRALSVCCSRRGDALQAVHLAERARLAAPLDVDTLELLARCQAEAGRLSEAEATCRKVLAFAPNHLGLRGMLAQILVAAGQADMGVAELTKVARANPKSAEALVALAATARQSGRLEQAQPLIEHALKLDPTHVTALRLKGEIALALGQFPERIAPADLTQTRMVVPRDMQASEFILLSRFLKGLAGEGAPVKLSADERFAPLIRHLRIAIDLADPGPDELVLPLPALLRCFDLDPAWLGGIKPYLHADPARGQRWLSALAGHPRPWIGVLWDGGAPGLPMEQLRAAIPSGGTCVSLMTGATRHGLANWPEAIDAGLHIASFDDLIAAISQLDFVVGPDVAALHLAGAMGTRGLVAAAAAQPWYWASRDGRSLWYPGMLVARQSRAADWSEPLSRLRQTLLAMGERQETEPSRG